MNIPSPLVVRHRSEARRTAELKDWLDTAFIGDTYLCTNGKRLTIRHRYVTTTGITRLTLAYMGEKRTWQVDR
jgi:hypothetical protein